MEASKRLEDMSLKELLTYRASLRGLYRSACDNVKQTRTVEAAKERDSIADKLTVVQIIVAMRRGAAVQS